MLHPRLRPLLALLGILAAAEVRAQVTPAPVPNLEGLIDRPLRYKPDGADFVIENGTEFFNRPLYGGNTGFRVDAGDKPEFTLYLPGRGGNLRLGFSTAAGSKWLFEAAKVTARYRPGSMLYEIEDPLLGSGGRLNVEVLALASVEGLVARVEATNIQPRVGLIFAYGGVNGQRGVRDGDIGTEAVPISEYFQLKPEFTRNNTFTITGETFALASAQTTIIGLAPPGTSLAIADANRWASWDQLVGSAGTTPALPVAIGHNVLSNRQPVFIGLLRGQATLAYSDLPRVFGETDAHFRDLRNRVSVDTPDPYLNAAVGALNVAVDAVWDEPQGAVMHGAIAWRQRLLGWRGPYGQDALGWHDRGRRNFDYWASRQNVTPIPAQLPPTDEASNLARSEAALHSNGDMSNSHYDMNAVFIDALFRHLDWTGDLDYARRMWPVIERHLAWERRMFRRPFGPDADPLYEAYAMIWASDDLGYNGGGVTHASAYNLSHNVRAASLARKLGYDPVPYEQEAVAISQAMRKHLWLADRGWFAEYKDLLGNQAVHPSAALWTFYLAIDGGRTTPFEAWQLSRYVDTQIPHLPVRGPGVPTDDAYHVLATTDWMPYSWSINNVVMGEVVHTALAYWQAGRNDEAYRLTKSSLLASMYMGITPGNVGSMNYLDVYRRESQRDFADGGGVLSRALIEGLFGLTPNRLADDLLVAPGLPEQWDHASLRHPEINFSFRRNGMTDTYVIEPKFGKPTSLTLMLQARRDELVDVTINGLPDSWHVADDSVGVPRIVISTATAPRFEVVVNWAGKPIEPPGRSVSLEQGALATVPLPNVQVTGLLDPQHVLDRGAALPGGIIGEVVGTPGARTVFARVKQNTFTWWMPVNFEVRSRPLPAATATATRFEPVDLAAQFNDQVTQIFKNEYRSPRSPYVSLGLPKQGIGAWAGHVNATAEIDDSGLRSVARNNNGRLILPSGVSFATPGVPDAKNIIFTSQWDNYPHEATVALGGRASRAYLLMAGSTNWMQSRMDNGEVVVTYTDGTTDRLALNNPINWWPIDQDYFIDDYQFRRPGPIPPRVDLKTGQVRLLDSAGFKGVGGTVRGGAATVLELGLDPAKTLQSLTVRPLANEVVIGLMAVTLAR